MDIKGLAQSKYEDSVIIFSASSCSKPVWVSLFCWTQKNIIFRRILVTKQLTIAIWLVVVEEIPPLYVKRFECPEKHYINIRDYYYYKEIQITMEVNGYHLVTNILLNIFFCVQLKKETHTGLDQLEGK